MNTAAEIHVLGCFLEERLPCLYVYINYIFIYVFICRQLIRSRGEEPVPCKKVAWKTFLKLERNLRLLFSSAHNNNMFWSFLQLSMSSFTNQHVRNKLGESVRHWTDVIEGHFHYWDHFSKCPQFPDQWPTFSKLSSIDNWWAKTAFELCVKYL